MLADLDLALKEPLKLVEKLFAHGGSSLDGFELRVQETFQLLLKDTARDEIVSITSSSDVSNLPRAGSLVRFRAMVQDTGYGTELYRAVGDTSRDQVLMYGLEETETPGAGGSASTPPASVQDYSNLRERQVFYVVSPPGETKWVKRALDGTQLESAMSHLDLAPSSSTRSNPCAMLPNKAPLPHEPHFGMIVKIYTDLGEKLRSTDVYEFVGVLGESPISNGFEDLFDRGGHDEAASDSSPSRVVPALHVLYAAPAPSPVASPVLDAADLEPIRTELIEYIAREGGLGGDFEAAEWILLALIAHIHTRHASGLALGSLSLNLAFPIASSSSSASMRAQESSSSQTSSTGAGPGSRLVHVLESIVPLLAPLSPTISSLNDLLTTRVSPRSRDESLDSGLLQLSKGTTVVVDLVQLGEGKLNDTGVRNLRSLATTISQQKLAYEFPFSSFELETDLNFIVVSEGKAIVPTDCVVYVEPRRCEETGRDARERDDESRLDRFRSYLRSVRESEFSIPPRMSDVIQADFVERRQASHAGPSSSSSSSSSKTAMTQEDLLFRMTVSRLVATSLGKRELDESSWTRTAELDERRKDRAPL